MKNIIAKYLGINVLLFALFYVGIYFFSPKESVQYRIIAYIIIALASLFVFLGAYFIAAAGYKKVFYTYLFLSLIKNIILIFFAILYSFLLREMIIFCFISYLLLLLLEVLFVLKLSDNKLVSLKK